MNPIVARAIGGYATYKVVDHMLPDYAEAVLAAAVPAILGGGSKTGKAYEAAGRGATTVLKKTARSVGSKWAARGAGWLIRKGTPVLIVLDILDLIGDLTSGDQERIDSNTYVWSSRFIWDHQGGRSMQARVLNSAMDIYASDPELMMSWDEQMQDFSPGWRVFRSMT